jgi:hypothetical protein
MSPQSNKNPNRREFLKVSATACAGTCLLMLGGGGFTSCTKSARKNDILPANGDFSLVSHCCLKCNECPAYIATQNNDQQLREETAKKWQMKPEQINCHGCKTPSALFNCSAKQCADKKGILTCAHCAEFPTCTIETWTKWPELKKRVEDMRKALGV